MEDLENDDPNIGTSNSKSFTNKHIAHKDEVHKLLPSNDLHLLLKKLTLDTKL